MVQNNKWNLSKERGQALAHKYILEILCDSRDQTITLSELIILLNQRTKHIKITHHSKKKSLSVYLKCNYGSVINFLDNFTMYGIIKKQSDIYVKLFDKYIVYNKENQPIFQKHEGWTFIYDEEFELI